MRYARTLLAAALVIAASSLALAQQTIKGKIAAVDKTAGKISIQIAGTSGTAGSAAKADATVAPTPFKVQDALLFNAVKVGDQVTVTTENVNGVATIKSLKKE